MTWREGTIRHLERRAACFRTPLSASFATGHLGDDPHVRPHTEEAMNQQHNFGKREHSGTSVEVNNDITLACHSLEAQFYSSKYVMVVSPKAAQGHRHSSWYSIKPIYVFAPVINAAHLQTIPHTIYWQMCRTD